MKRQDLPPPWLLMFMRHQAMLHALGSVSIEVPALRPAFERLAESLDGRSA